MDRLKVMTIIGTRPEIIKLSEVIRKCDRCFEHILVHTGQNYDYKLNKVFFEELGLREPDFYLNVAGHNLGATMGNILSKSYELMERQRPEAVLILGDTNSALSAISAKRLKIPIFHMEAGNRCFDENLPEEINRKIVDHVSDVNLAYTEHARRYLYAEGIRKEWTYVTGSPMREVIDKHWNSICSSKVMETLGLEKNKYILLSAHREENIDIEENFYELIDTINAMAEIYNVPVIYSIHPRSAKFIQQRGVTFQDNIREMEPFGFFDYVFLQKNAFCVVSDSGTLAEESAILNVPAVSIRTSTERPEAIDKGRMVIGGIKKASVLQAIQLAVNGTLAELDDVDSYADNYVSDKVVKIIQGYTSIVNMVGWRKGRS